MKEINVEEIMAQIRRDIEEKGYTYEMLSFKDVNALQSGANDFNPDEFKNIVSSIEMNKYVPWIQSDLGVGIKGVTKKVIRKIVGFVVAPMSDGQNMFNQQVAEAFKQMQGYIEKQDLLLEKYEKRIEALEKKVR